MLTRIEVDGFKNLLDFAVDFGPFTCIAGPNGVGKSNVFDAIRFLSLLADRTLLEAALEIRGNEADSSDIRDLFWCSGQQRRSDFRIAAEMIINPGVVDDFGRPAEATSTFLRYEVKIGFEAPEYLGTLGRLVLLSETLDYITEGDAAGRLKFPHNAKQFRQQVVINKRRTQSGFISVRQAADGKTEIIVHQDGGSRGPGQIAPAETAPRTIVGTSNTAVTPTILGARREMQAWSLLALEPSAMRRPDRFQAAAFISASGAHLPATLYRLATRTRDERPEAVWANIANRLASLVPVSDLRVDVDQVRQLLTVVVRELSGTELPAASLSDGTLRFLTLAVLAEDPWAREVLCIEEPENGIHPAKMEEMVRLLRDLAVNAHEEPGPDNPLRQVIVATHSPAFVQLQNPDDLLCAQDARVRTVHGPARTLRCLPQPGTWRARAGEPSVGLASIMAYLSAPPNAQLQLPDLDSLLPQCASTSS